VWFGPCAPHIQIAGRAGRTRKDVFGLGRWGAEPILHERSKSCVVQFKSNAYISTSTAGLADEPPTLKAASGISSRWGQFDGVVLPAIDSQSLDQLSYSFPQLGNYRLFEPRMFSHPHYAAPTWMRQWEELWRVL
jgi:hypothetical protein